MLWSIFFNDLLSLISHAYSCADDCTLSFRCTPSNRNEVIQSVNCALKNISGSCKKWQIILAAEQTQAAYTKKRVVPINSCLKIYDTSVEFSKEINILGIKIDSGLTFASHVKTDAIKTCRQ